MFLCTYYILHMQERKEQKHQRVSINHMNWDAKSNDTAAITCLQIRLPPRQSSLTTQPTLI